MHQHSQSRAILLICSGDISNLIWKSCSLIAWEHFGLYLSTVLPNIQFADTQQAIQILIINSVKIQHQSFHLIQKSLFLTQLGLSSRFLGQKDFFQKNLTLTQLYIIFEYLKSRKTNDPILWKSLGQMDGQNDLCYKTLPDTTRGPTTTNAVE